jgi:hypothetical protein
MKFFKSLFVLLSLLFLSYAVSASYISAQPLSNIEVKQVKDISTKPAFEKLIFNGSNTLSDPQQPTQLPLNADIIFAFTAIATLSAYLFAKNKL